VTRRQIKQFRAGRGQPYSDYRIYFSVETYNENETRAEELQEKYLGPARAQADREAFAAMRAAKRAGKSASPSKRTQPDEQKVRPPTAGTPKAPTQGTGKSSTATTEAHRTTAKFVADSHERLRRFNAVMDRLQTYWKLYNAYQHAMSLLEAITDMTKLLAHGTAMPEEQKKADALLAASQEAKQYAESETDDISTFAWITLIGEAARRKDAQTVFQLDSTLIDLRVAMDKAARGYEELSSVLGQQADALNEARLKLIISVLMPNASGTANNAIAAALYISVEKLQGHDQVRVADLCRGR
jgi:hypothetical protein